MGVRIVLAEGEPVAKALKRFRKLLEREGVRYMAGQHEYYTKPGQVRRLKRGVAKLHAQERGRFKRMELGIEPQPH